MSATQIYIASAGSGKTFTLVKEYLKIVFRAAHHGNYHVFRNILAITFTNKATLEMKQRIVDELKEIAHGKETDQLESLKASLPFIKDFKALADKVLIRILHDYSNFNIQTIDSFFQNIVKVFAKELDLPLNYEVIINNEEGIEYAVDNLMEQIGQNATITKWLEEYAYSEMDKEKSWDFRSILIALSQEVFNKGNYNQEATLTIDELRKIKTTLSTFIKNFEKHIEEKAQEIVHLIELNGMPIEGIQRNFYNPILKLANGEKAYSLNATCKSVISGEKPFYNKTKLSKFEAEVIALQSAGFDNLLADLNEFLEDQHPTYISYEAVFKNIYALAVINQIATFLKQYREEKNALFLMDTAKLINGFISIDDTPFLFEKLASRIQYLFIDEFQDTSTLQWENLRPIIENILSSADKPLQILIVGDAKQSIYRFRGGDYELLTHKAANSLTNYNGAPITLSDNWRSLPTIVSFNNSFFRHVVDASNFSDDTALASDMNLAYNGLEQTIKKDKANGYVNVAILDNSEKNAEEKALDKMINDIQLLKTKGYKLHDMAILVKTKNDGVKISQHLQANEIEIVSQETLLLKFDNEVKLLLAGLNYVHQKSEPLYYVNLLHQFALVHDINVANFDLFADHKHKALLYKWVPNFELETSGEQSLLHLLETMILQFKINVNSNLFVSHFKQVIINFYKNTSTSLSDFLEWWLIEGPKLSVVVEESQDKIKVMTIHKSKGLEFPIVLMPFCNWKFKTKLHNNYLWVEDDSIQNGVQFPVKATSSLANSHYAAPYLEEVKLNWIDNANQLYVAFTRAKDVLLVSCIYENINKNGDLNTAAQLVRQVLENQGVEVLKDEDFIFEQGNLDGLPIKDEDDTTLPKPKMKSISSNINKLQQVEIDKKISTSSVDVGNLVHQALFYLSLNEADVAFAKAAAEDNYNAKDIATAKQHFFSLIDKNNLFGKWINECENSWDEQTIYYDSKELRPDKLIELKDKFIVVDFKTGEPLKKYHNQVKNYVNAVAGIGVKKPIEGYILYTENGQLEKVDTELKLF